uniref:DNA-directed RNA polymerase III subunit RPC3 n=1 Tax=Parascaris equorum TaxID=6256 RepID=A0A914RU21_PAREQ
MSSAEVDACVEILEDHFGGLVASVGRVLLGGEATLPIIALRLRKLNVGLVNVQRLARSARCSFLVKTLYGEVAEAICEELVCHGRLSCSECLRRVKTKFARLAETQLVIRCPLVEAEDYDCPVFEKQTDPFIMPDLILSAVKQNTANHDSSSTTRKRKHEGGGSGDVDADILWRLNHPRFERYMRDEMVVDAVSKIDSFGAECVKTIRTLLKISELKADSRAAASLPISVVQDASMLNNEMLFSYRRLWSGLEDFEKAISVQCQSNIESIIREKFDSVAIEKLAMLSSKESKELCYTLLDEHFISVRLGHVAKTNDFAPARTFCLYHVDLSGRFFDSETLRNVGNKFQVSKNDLLCHEMELNHDALLFSLFIDFAKRRL